MADTGTSAKEYMSLLASRAGQLLHHGRPSSYPRSLAAVTQLAFDKLRSEDPAAAELAAICSFLAPEPIPADWLSRDPSLLPVSLAERAADPVAWRLVVAQVGAQALVRTDTRGLQTHRVTQAILRDHLPQAQAAVIRAAAEAIVTSSDPGDAGEPKNWPEWARLLPHVLALAPTTNSGRLRDLACGASWYLIRRGDPRTSRDLSSRLHQQWTDRLGPDSESTRRAASALAAALRAMGHYDDARQLDEAALARFRSLLGDDHPDTLRAASALATDLRGLGELEAARDLDEDGLTRFRRLLGDDHPSTLISASCLASDLRGLGELEAARDLDRHTLTLRRRVLGDDHPETLISASSLANDLRKLGDFEAAHNLDHDTLARRRRLLGDDHHRTLKSASSLAADLRGLGKFEAARDLDRHTLTLRRRVLGDDHPETLISAANLAKDQRMLDA